MELKWNDQGLVPAIAQDANTGRILMLAWMNGEALEQTRSSGTAHFYSRSRQRLWQKGESSGNRLDVVSVRVDCDADAVLLLVVPRGPACHTGATSCFFREPVGEGSSVEPDAHGTEWTADDGPPGGVLERLERVIEARRQATAERSYTRSLLDGGMTRIADKIAEEHGELAAELTGDGDADAIVHESADLLYHVLVGLRARDVAIADVLRELGRRFGVGGHDEKAAR